MPARSGAARSAPGLHPSLIRPPLLPITPRLLTLVGRPVRPEGVVEPCSAFEPAVRFYGSLMAADLCGRDVRARPLARLRPPRSRPRGITGLGTYARSSSAPGYYEMVLTEGDGRRTYFQSPADLPGGCRWRRGTWDFVTPLGRPMTRLPRWGRRAIRVFECYMSGYPLTGGRRPPPCLPSPGAHVRSTQADSGLVDGLPVGVSVLVPRGHFGGGAPHHVFGWGPVYSRPSKALASSPFCGGRRCTGFDLSARFEPSLGVWASSSHGQASDEDPRAHVLQLGFHTRFSGAAHTGDQKNTIMQPRAVSLALPGAPSGALTPAPWALPTA